MQLQGVTREGVVIALLAVCVFLLLALFSYSPVDPGWSHSGPDQSVSNWMGRIGAWLSDVLYSLFGASALWWPGMFGLGAWRIMRQHQVQIAWDPVALAVHSGGLMLLLMSTTTLGDLHFYNPASDLPNQAGGILGKGIAAALSAVAGVHGATLIAIAAFLSGFTLFTSMSWLTVMDELGRSMNRLFHWSRTQLATKRDQRRAEREAAAVDRHRVDEGTADHCDPEQADTEAPRARWWSRFLPGNRAPDLEQWEGQAPRREPGLDGDADETAEEVSAWRHDDRTDIPWDVPAKTPSAKRPEAAYASRQQRDEAREPTLGNLSGEPASRDGVGAGGAQDAAGSPTANRGVDAPRPFHPQSSSATAEPETMRASERREPQPATHEGSDRSLSAERDAGERDAGERDAGERKAGEADEGERDAFRADVTRRRIPDAFQSSSDAEPADDRAAHVAEVSRGDMPSETAAPWQIRAERDDVEETRYRSSPVEPEKERADDRRPAGVGPRVSREEPFLGDGDRPSERSAGDTDTERLSRREPAADWQPASTPSHDSEHDAPEPRFDSSPDRAAGDSAGTPADAESTTSPSRYAEDASLTDHPPTIRWDDAEIVEPARSAASAAGAAAASSVGSRREPMLGSEAPSFASHDEAPDESELSRRGPEPAFVDSGLVAGRAEPSFGERTLPPTPEPAAEARREHESPAPRDDGDAVSGVEGPQSPAAEPLVGSRQADVAARVEASPMPEPSIASASQARAAAEDQPTLWTVEHLQSQRPVMDDLPEPSGELPSVRLTTPADPEQPNYTPEQLSDMAELLEMRLREYGVKAEVVDTWPGPVITRFEIKPAAGVKVSKISNLAKDLARSLMVKSVRVVEIIPGKPTVGIEIPNPNRAMIRIRQVLESSVYQDADSPVTLALGQDIGGKPVVANLNKMPHLLVAGTTGSGKSVGINTMLVSMLLKATPDEVRMIMVDPKMLELSVYDGIPHLLAPVVTDMKEAANALRWCVAEMERRYKLMAAMGVRNLAGFNAKLDEAERHGAQVQDPLWEPQPWEMHEQPPTLTKLPYIVVVIDEFADMFMIVGKKVEELIARLAQKARAAGIHLILATQRPSVDVVTGLIKANIPTRMAFQVSSKIDSRTILDQGGAENLLGHGDMLYLPSGAGMPQRVHGAFVDDDEVHRIVEDWKRRGEPEYIEEILSGGVSADALAGLEADGSSDGDDAEQDALYDEAVQFVTESRRASISAVQRRFKIGYNRAARLVEAMEQAGVVSSMGNNGSREVLAPPPVGN